MKQINSFTNTYLTMILTAHSHHDTSIIHEGEQAVRMNATATYQLGGG